MIGKTTVVISRKQGRAEIVHGIIGQESQPLPFHGLHTQDTQFRIYRATGSNGIETFVARVHVSPYVDLSEWIRKHPIRPTDPSPVERMIPVVLLGPCEARGLHALKGLDHRLGQQRGQESGIGRIHPTTQTPHRRRCGMSMRGGYHHAISGNPRHHLHSLLGLIDQIARHHARIDHTKNDRLIPLPQAQ